MNLRTYQAHSLTEALTRIKTDLGQDAVVLHSRTFRRGGVLGFGGQLIYEVTASTPAPRERKSLSPAQRTAPARSRPQAASTDPQASRAAAMALALAEQERRRRQALAEPKPTSAPAAAPPATPQPEPPAPPLRAIPTHTRSATPTKSNGATAPPPATPPTSASPLPVAQRYVLASPAPSGSAPPTPRKQAAPTKPLAAPKPKRVATAATNEARTAPPAPAPLPTQSIGPGLHDEISALKQMVSQVLQRQSGTLQSAMPEALFNEYVSLIQNEVAQEIADELCDVVRRELTDAQLDDTDAVRDSFRKHLAQYVPVAPESTLTRSTDGRPFTIALVGPTGVGKTTTVAKLAAAFKLRHNRRVGLITTDTYRIAAVDQLRTYANIIGIPLKVALSPDEMRDACESLANCDVILIDTAGRSPNDAARLEEIRAFATAASPHEVHLVLSSTCSEQVLMRTIERFSTVNADRVIFTKTDEAVSLGVLINVMRKAGKELSFITTGQEVPDHIEAGSSDRLASLVLGEKG